MKDDPDTETKTQEPETKPEEKPEEKPEVKPETKPEVKPETKPEVKPETKPETKVETKPETNDVADALAAAQKRIDDLEARNTASSIRAAVADKANMVREADVVAAMIDVSKANTPEGLKAEIERIKTSFPSLFHSTGSADGGAQGSGAVESAPGLARVSAAYASTTKTR